MITLPVREDFVGDPRRPALHGGVVSALVDTTGGAAAWAALGPGESVSTVDLRVDFLEPARLAGPLRAEARLLRKGNRVCHVRDERDPGRAPRGRGLRRLQHPPEETRAVTRIPLPMLALDRPLVECTDCGRCCTYVGVGINAPTSPRYATDVLWYLYHQGVYVYVDGEREWSVHFEARCKNLGADLRCARLRRPAAHLPFASTTAPAR